MARSKRSKKQESEVESWKPQAALAWHRDIHPEIKKIVAAIIFFIFAGLFALSYIGKSGSAGSLIARLFGALLGKGYFFAPLMFVLLGFSILVSAHRKILVSILIGGVLFLSASLAGLHVLFGSGSGGMIGSALGEPLMRLFDFWASILLITGMFIISLLLILNMPVWKREEAQEEDEGGIVNEATAGVRQVLENFSQNIRSAFEKKADEGGNTLNVQEPSPQADVAPAFVREKEEASIAVRKIAKKFNYQKPPLELLQSDRGKPSSGDIRANSNIIKRTLENFGIMVEMGEVSVGPTVTQYTLRPAEGVKLARITALHNDLSLALAAHPIRIEAPIPGKSLVGIEVPNRSIALVGLRALLEHQGFSENPSPLVFALGRDVAGVPVFADLGKMPHLLVSGATGSGKSVCIHSIMTSFIYRNPPELLRFIVVDPKRVELSVYNDIPHLLAPVITDAKVTVRALRWALGEMDRRYDILSSRHCRDIASYNMLVAKEKAGKGERGEEEGPELLPNIIILIDELADIMMTFPREVEAGIVRLAQMARAVGIHLIVATQRPSVEVITGLIKANIPSRIAFQVASQVDSRTILDAAGAEKLLGNGDMLFLAGDMAKPKRIQGGLVSEQEVKRVVDFLREQRVGPVFDEAILQTHFENGRGEGGADDFSEEDDPLYPEARAIVIEAGKASASFLQRRLKMGYARAARMLDFMEAEGLIGPADGAKPREILMGVADFRKEDVEEN